VNIFPTAFSLVCSLPSFLRGLSRAVLLGTCLFKCVRNVLCYGFLALPFMSLFSGFRDLRFYARVAFSRTRPELPYPPKQITSRFRAVETIELRSIAFSLVFNGSATILVVTLSRRVITRPVLNCSPTPPPPTTPSFISPLSPFRAGRKCCRPTLFSFGPAISPLFNRFRRDFRGVSYSPLRPLFPFT